MNKRPLIIGPEERAAIKGIIDHAEKNIFSMDDLLDMKNGHRRPPGDEPGFSCIIPRGYRCVFSIENQVNGRLRHLSISVSTAGMLPNMIAVEELMREFGFKNNLRHCIVAMEKLSPTRQAINILEYISS